MKKFYLFVFILVLFIFQYSVLGVFLDNARIPNLFVALAVSLAIVFGFEKSVGWLILAGILMDAGSLWLFGSGILALVVILWLVDKLKVVTELHSKRYLFVFLFSLIVLVSSFIFDVMLKFEIGAERYFFRSALVYDSPQVTTDYLLKLIYAAILGLGVYYFSRKARSYSSLPRNA